MFSRPNPRCQDRAAQLRKMPCKRSRAQCAPPPSPTQPPRPHTRPHDGPEHAPATRQHNQHRISLLLSCMAHSPRRPLPHGHPPTLMLGSAPASSSSTTLPSSPSEHAISSSRSTGAVPPGGGGGGEAGAGSGGGGGGAAGGLGVARCAALAGWPAGGLPGAQRASQCPATPHLRAWPRSDHTSPQTPACPCTCGVGRAGQGTGGDAGQHHPLRQPAAHAHPHGARGQNQACNTLAAGRQTHASLPCPAAGGPSPLPHPHEVVLHIAGLEVVAAHALEVLCREGPGEGRLVGQETRGEARH